MKIVVLVFMPLNPEIFLGQLKSFGRVHCLLTTAPSEVGTLPGGCSADQ